MFVYYAALLNGYSPDTIIDASPITVGEWTPENYGGQQYGRMSMADAFAHSVNSAAARLAMTVGLEKVTAAARELGLIAPLKQVPSMALGSNEVTLLDLTGAFASVRAGRPKLKPWGIAGLSVDGALRPLGAPAARGNELPQRDALIRLLREVVGHGTGQGASVGPGTAGKTGTSQDYRDAWFIGFNEDLVVGVWVGNDDQTPMRGVTGGSLPAQIWKRFVSRATPLMRARPEQQLSSQTGAQTITAPASAEASIATQSSSDSRSCNMEACASRYSSFRSSDCTYQPLSGGARRLCSLTRDTTYKISKAQRAAEVLHEDTEPTGTIQFKRAERVRSDRRRSNRPTQPLALDESEPGSEFVAPRSQFDGLPWPFGGD
jgi:membrane peptidoglycan carboxypeptidase